MVEPTPQPIFRREASALPPIHNRCMPHLEGCSRCEGGRECDSERPGRRRALLEVAEQCPGIRDGGRLVVGRREGEDVTCTR